MTQSPTHTPQFDQHDAGERTDGARKVGGYSVARMAHHSIHQPAPIHHHLSPIHHPFTTHTRVTPRVQTGLWLGSILLICSRCHQLFDIFCIFIKFKLIFIDLITYFFKPLQPPLLPLPSLQPPPLQPPLSQALTMDDHTEVVDKMVAGGFATLNEITQYVSFLVVCYIKLLCCCVIYKWNIELLSAIEKINLNRFF